MRLNDLITNPMDRRDPGVYRVFAIAKYANNVWIYDAIAANDFCRCAQISGRTEPVCESL